MAKTESPTKAEANDKRRTIQVEMHKKRVFVKRDAREAPPTEARRVPSMRVERVRVQNFRCIRDSGEIPIDDQVTVLVGANGCGKSAILDALRHFNRGESFQEVDVSTMSGEMRQKLRRRELSRDSVEMVSVWVSLSEKDSMAMRLPPEFQGISSFQITKTLDNAYKVLTGDGKPLEEIARAATRTQREVLVTALEKLWGSIANVYCGQVKRMGPTFDYTFLEKNYGEPDSENVFLSREYAEPIWSQIDEGDWVQVTKIALDPFGRNARALNAGLKVDLAPALDDLLVAARSDSDDAKLRTSFNSFSTKLKALPTNHPLKDYVPDAAVAEVADILTTVEKVHRATDVGQTILEHLPRFEYLAGLETIADHAPTTIVQSRSKDKGHNLLASVLNAAGFDPATYVESDHANKLKYQTDAKEAISQLLREYWVRNDLIVEFAVYEQAGQQSVGIAVVADGSADPPSRRSQGLRSFLSLFAALAELALSRNVVLLLDDPALYLHPVAQKKLLALLEKQPYQIMMATHLPFMIDPDRLERVRVVRRTISGSQIEHDWAKAQEDLLPVWGAFFGNLNGSYCLLVEGKDDREYYTSLSKVCKKSERQHLGSNVCVLPPGGATHIPHAARALSDRGVFVVALVDGDKAGKTGKSQLSSVFGANSRRVVSLDQVIADPAPEVEDLFSPEFRVKHDVRVHGLSQVVQRLGDDPDGFDERTLQNFETCFRLVNDALAPREPS